jgi:hypothetical protein
MTYRPRETAFGPPIAARIPSALYLVAALAAGTVVLLGEQSAPGTKLFHYVVEEDVQRVMSVRTFAIILLVSALASVVRAGMRGVRIFPDGVEARDVVNFIVPKLRRYRWPQIEQIVLDAGALVALDLWDGTRAWLPEVSDHDGLVTALTRVARARAIPIRGGHDLEGDEGDGDVDEESEE